MDNKNSKRKLVTSALALSLAAAIALGGTLAWQSANQEAVNEKIVEANPGGRLHDDFDGRNKDVYVENFSSEEDGQPIFARVKLVEYMETGKDAGKNADQAAADRTDLEVKSLITGADISKPETWKVFKPNDASNVFRNYWTLKTDGGKTVFMPTFNMNKDSLSADVNGKYEEAKDDKLHYADYTVYTAGQTKEDDEIWDYDDNDVDEGDNTQYYKLGKVQDGVVYNAIKVKNTHTAKETLEAKVMTMAEWKAMDENAKTGDFWVWDTDGWAYWANPIQPGEATGLLLDEVTPKNISEKYYYSITAIAQFCTADDMGSDNGTGFYDTAKGTVPSTDAKSLLDLIAK